MIWILVLGDNAESLASGVLNISWFSAYVTVNIGVVALPKAIP
jgi:hypothetical protein